ncbi:DNA recombination protein RmuC [Enterovirga aerilata]|uniref:DNA recombination protein RmuC homolog n=1 Tax=Enterovirga aerilata TaxID=2730920 RepID=A0A849I1E2_9HYPH|nr:DNA recombination protein RmuC [Enterovirga sp. DB1703]NNM71394.1 DNA recombination protein RmuC [Enterovirga sp. DB1703]
MPFDPVWLAILLGCITSILSGVAAFRPRVAGDPLLRNALDELSRDLGQLRTALAEDLKRGRDETGSQARDLRQEVQTIVARLGETLGANIGLLGTAQAEKLDSVVVNVKSLAEANERRLGEMRRDADEGGKALREEVVRQLKALAEFLDGNLEKGAASQKERLDGVATEIRRLIQTNAEANENLRQTVEGKLETLRNDNAQKLEEMRRTVDEKLQGTLEERLGEKFKIVSHQLEQVFKSVGEMQSLASGVGDLKRVLTNVKTRGTWAEVSLGHLLEQVMAPEQFVRNVEVKPGSGERVEFAIRLPGQGEGDAGVLLPIDAKFPSEDYERLLDASERADGAAVEAALKGLEARIRQEGQTICTKYIWPPDTTDFAILYLPTEGLYAEVIRRPGLVDHLQAQCRIVVAGPTVLLAILNSLRMGFRTLAIQKRSSEVWQTLAAVKTEFGKYGEVLDAVRKKLNEATNQIDKVAVRKRAIDRKLREVESLPEGEAGAVLSLEKLIQEGDLLDAAE